jgi:nucleotidyltransferase substrate binding protein (TIGR01987 family)
MGSYIQKLENYKKALARLNEGIEKFDKTDDLQRDGLIQRFKYTFELAWKTLKAIFEEEGLIGMNSPTTVLREAFTANLISDEEVWLMMLNDRNSTAHIYSKEIVIKICNNITTKYLSEFEKLMKQIQVRKNN